MLHGALVDSPEGYKDLPGRRWQDIVNSAQYAIDWFDTDSNSWISSPVEERFAGCLVATEIAEESFWLRRSNLLGSNAGSFNTVLRHFDGRVADMREIVFAKADAELFDAQKHAASNKPTSLVLRHEHGASLLQFFLSARCDDYAASFRFSDSDTSLLTFTSSETGQTFRLLDPQPLVVGAGGRLGDCEVIGSYKSSDAQAQLPVGPQAYTWQDVRWMNGSTEIGPDDLHSLQSAKTIRVTTDNSAKMQAESLLDKYPDIDSLSVTLTLDAARTSGANVERRAQTESSSRVDLLEAVDGSQDDLWQLQYSKQPDGTSLYASGFVDVGVTHSTDPVAQGEPMRFREMYASFVAQRLQDDHVHDLVLGPRIAKVKADGIDIEESLPKSMRSFSVEIENAKGFDTRFAADFWQYGLDVDGKSVLERVYVESDHESIELPKSVKIDNDLDVTISLINIYLTSCPTGHDRTSPACIRAGASWEGPMVARGAATTHADIEQPRRWPQEDLQ